MSQSSDRERNPSLLTNRAFLIETLYLILILLVTILILLDLVDTGFFLGPLRFSHWAGIVGAIFMLIYTPIFYVVKRRFPNQYRILINIHVFGFTTAFLLVSIHFAGQLSRPLQFYPDLGAGLGLYIIVLILVITGYLHRYHPFRIKSGKYIPPHANKVLHVSLVSGLYIIIIVHMMLNFFL
jgi:hypothetical protein